MTNPQRSISAVLVANRGEVVSRVARSAARFGIRTIGVYTDSDAESAYLADVDMAIALGDDSGSSPYLDIESILAAAKLAGADAIHPGYGFLAENAEFAEACEQNGLVWIGPSPETMREMAGKIRAKELARDAGVPVLESIEVDEGIDAIRIRADKLGFPLLIKPSAGGGGKGMHRVEYLDDLDEAISRARREAQSSFGDDTLFIERYIERPRHVEVQIFGDQHGNVIHLGDRDCSIQRRHQKIVEEAPAPGLPDGVRRQMADSAVALAKRIGYVGAGTVEFLYFDNQIAFLEMNTRLQVEHSVTEEVTGLDLVELQLRVAAGESLPKTQDEVVVAGHAIEVRLYAEDPANDFLPSPGLVRKFEVPVGSTARWELGVRTGSRIGTRYDPMIAKVIAKGTTREEAANGLLAALSGMRVHGVVTNRDLLARIVRSQDFLGANLTTAFLDEHPEVLNPTNPPGMSEFHALGAVVHGALVEQERKQVQRFAPFGWRNLCSQNQVVKLSSLGREYEVRYRQGRDMRWSLALSDVEYVARVFVFDSTRIEVAVSGQRREIHVTTYPDHTIVESDMGETRFVQDAPLEELSENLTEGRCVATIPGSVVDVCVEPGQRVDAGTTMLVLEAMKMEHRITSDAPGIVERVLVAVGDSVDYQQLLIEVGAVREAAAHNE